MLRPKAMNVPTLELEGRARKRAKVEAKIPHEAQYSGLDGVCRTPEFGEEDVSKAGAHTVQRIGSMERYFGSQSLASPPANMPAEPQQDATEGLDWPDASPERQFTISYSQHYSRPQSLQSSPAEQPDQPPASPAEEAIADRQAGPAAEAAAGVEQQAGSAGSAGAQAVGSKRGPVGALLEGGGPGEDTTPELAVGTPVGRSKLFPVFRRRGDYKVVHLIRHGESEFNAAASSSKSWEDPQIFNPNLTAKGQAQARKLRGQLQAMKLGGKALWVSSPLARAMQTMLLGCPHSELLGQTGPDNAFRTAIRGESSEHLMTTGDIGAPASHLRDKFPQLREALKPLSERWWYMPHANDAVKRQCTSYETKRHLQERVGQFRRWLQEQPERVIVVFGHSTFLREFIGGGKHLKNCELFTLHL